MSTQLKEEQLFSTLPTTPQEESVIKRAKQLTDFKWTPVRDVPTFFQGKNTVIPAGIEAVGFPYSSTERTDKFFWENVSFETFLSAIPNPDSVLYQPGKGKFDACSYGIVCNGLVRYALGIPRRISTVKWLTTPGMTFIAKRGEYTAQDIKLLDVLYACNEGRNHVELITDILKDANGKVVKIELSGAIRPTCKRRSFTVEEFFEKYKLFHLCRYDLSKVPPVNEEDDKLLAQIELHTTRPQITVDNGNKSNYLQGQPILISVFNDQPDTVKIYKGDQLVESIPVWGIAKVTRYLDRGYYKAVLENSNSFVEFCVNQAEISHVVNKDEITISANPCDEKSEIFYFDYRIEGEKAAALDAYFELTEEEKTTGKFTRKLTQTGKNFKVYFKNEYGVWVHPMTPIE